MAFITKGNKIIMDAYDYGIQLPFDVTGVTFALTDKMRFELKKSKDSDVLFIKEFRNELDNTAKFRFFLEFTQEESNKITPGNYIYYVKYLKDDEVLDTIVSGEAFQIKNGNV